MTDLVSSIGRSRISPASSSKNSSSSRWCASRFSFILRSAFVAIVSLPLGVLIAFIVMQRQGINANIMSLGGIAIAIGAMVDAAIVMIENAHKHLEHWHAQNPRRELSSRERWVLIGEASAQVGPALFFSLLIITLSFIPIFTLEAQEGRLFAPLAYTKTYAMAASAGLAVTLIPVLMGYLIRGRIPSEDSNPHQSRAGEDVSPRARTRACVAARDDRRRARAARAHRHSRAASLEVSSCRHSMRATCFTCPPHSRVFPPARPRSCCNRWIVC